MEVTTPKVPSEALIIGLSVGAVASIFGVGIYSKENIAFYKRFYLRLIAISLISKTKMSISSDVFICALFALYCALFAHRLVSNEKSLVLSTPDKRFTNANKV